MSDIRIVFNRLLNGWFVVRGAHQTPLNGRFDTRAEAVDWLLNRRRGFDDRVRGFRERNSDGHY